MIKKKPGNRLVGPFIVTQGEKEGIVLNNQQLIVLAARREQLIAVSRWPWPSFRGPILGSILDSRPLPPGCFASGCMSSSRILPISTALGACPIFFREFIS